MAFIGAVAGHRVLRWWEGSLWEWRQPGVRIVRLCCKLFLHWWSKFSVL